MVLGVSILETVSQILEKRVTGRTVACLEARITGKSRRHVFFARV